MKLLGEREYYQTLAKLQEDYIKESPCGCDPNITNEQLKAWLKLQSFKENTTFVNVDR